MKYERINYDSSKVSDFIKQIAKRYKQRSVYIYLDCESNSYVIYRTERYGMGRLIPVGRFDPKTPRPIYNMRSLLKTYENTVDYCPASYIKSTYNVKISDKVLEQCVYKYFGCVRGHFGRYIDIAVLEWKSEDFRQAIDKKFESKFEEELNSQVNEAYDTFYNEY